ncbi:hypothetical protein GCM10018785_27370 [Streptomyces longispororuber]|uniref:Uncharacterized protein n=2 Tax=Streptomyces longispororuber TaxID=68230 RepID=A0A918ZJQ2_9ACTN|nr:hypothetical protein GCM10018785_27370 [Streptomyces longispororuber]
MLGRGEEAQAEARKAYATELAKPWHRALPDSNDAQRAATEAAPPRGHRPAPPNTCSPCGGSSCAAPVRPAPRSQRLPELAARWTARSWR